MDREGTEQGRGILSGSALQLLRLPAPPLSLPGVGAVLEAAPAIGPQAEAPPF